MFQRLRSLFSPPPPPPKKNPPKSAATAASATATASATANANANATPPPDHQPHSPASLCGLTPDMTPDQIRSRLAHLYRRHNQAASSLDPDLRREAELMLDAVVLCRETLLPPPSHHP